MEDKVIVTHRSALMAKYGKEGVKRIHAALSALAAKDMERGLKTRIVYLDDAATMKKLKAATLANSNNRRDAKSAIDGVYKALKPDFLLIVGAPDIVPHQDIRNPALQAGDDDEFAFGDIPYACDVPYSRDPAQFIGPTRVVGRLPDLAGAKEPSHLLALLKVATEWKGRRPEVYSAHFGLSAAVWQVSTTLSLDAVFGNRNTPLLSPKKGPQFSTTALGAAMHFINCHGASGRPEFSGQSGQNYPISLTTKSIKDKISNGTVASVECCYGGELYNSEILGVDMPICQSYLRQGAYGYLGSTTIAYGPADRNGAADLICQFFLKNIRDGASVGRAALMARQQFVAKVQQMDPMDLKTLAQFCLYGDPSIRPVLKAEAGFKGKSLSASNAEAERFRRSETRASLKQTGDFLKATKPTAANPDARRGVSKSAKAILARIAREGGLKPGQAFVPYKVKGAPSGTLGKGFKAAAAPSRYLLTIALPQSKAKGGLKAARKRLEGLPVVEPKIAIVAKEVNGKIVDYRIYHRR